MTLKEKTAFGGFLFNAFLRHSCLREEVTVGSILRIDRLRFFLPFRLVHRRARRLPTLRRDLRPRFVINAEPYNLREEDTVGSIHESTV